MHPPIGWAIGGREVYEDIAEQDADDAASFYDVLEHQIVETFYDRDATGVPRRWVAGIRESIATLGPLWTSSRMVREYTSKYYVPGAQRAGRLAERRASRARDAARYLARVRRSWARIQVGTVCAEWVSDEQLRVHADVELGDLASRDVEVQLWIDRGAGDASAAPEPMQVGSRAGTVRGYEQTVDRKAAPPGTVFAVRVLPCHPSVDDVLSTGLVAWSG